MLKAAQIAAAFTVAAFATAVAAPAAIAEAPGCKNRVNPYVACTNNLKAKTPIRTSNRHFHGVVNRFSQGRRD
jgi:hypothetical protein